MAVVAALDAQEMLPALSMFIVQAKSTPGLTAECQTPLRKWSLIYERLEMGVFKLAEELDVDMDTVEQVNFYILFLNSCWRDYYMLRRICVTTAQFMQERGRAWELEEMISSALCSH
jgi:hypothetical protein